MRAGIWIAYGVLVLGAGCEVEPASCLSNISVDLTSTVAHGYNTAVRGMSGQVNVPWACSGGGSAQITGTVTPTASSTTFNLTFDFTACADTTTSSDLVLTGRLTDQSTFSTSTGDVTAKIAHADALTIVGDEVGCNASPIDATCVVDLFVSGGTTSGAICGLDF